MEKQFITPKFPLLAALGLLVVVIAELIGYGLTQNILVVWILIIFGLFYLGYTAIFRNDILPLIFSTLFFTAYYSLFFNINTNPIPHISANNLPISLLFFTIFAVNSVIMWFLLHYATHLKREYHIANTIIAGFLIAQIVTLLATMERDWPIRLELASYIPTVFSYVFWRFACLSADSVLGWKQFIRLAVLVLVLILIMVIGSPNVQV